MFAPLGMTLPQLFKAWLCFRNKAHTSHQTGQGEVSNTSYKLGEDKEVVG